jgi:filamentous hemagglutinin family protein
MNHIYRLIWNAELLRWSVVPESAKRHGKPSSTTRTARHQGRDGFSPNRHDSASHVPPAWRWKPALCYLLAFQQLMVPTLASAQAIVADGRTATTVSTSGSVTNVTTGTVRANNAFNSFSVFNVAQGTTANLFLPNGTLNLINLVRDQRTTIDGMLNAIKDGKIGGNVYFANPNGFLVSQSGVVNVGSLSLSTPTTAYIDSFFSSPGNPNDAAVASLLSGTAPRNAALISILGQINAIDSISLSAGAINVGGSLYAGARFIGNAPNFTDVVNANGLVSANNVVMKEGRIEIVADNDVTVSGTIATPGGSGVRGGDIAIRAGGNVDLQSGSVISSRGNGDNSAGGTVNIWADGNAVTRQGALVDASAGLSGNGGAIEFSAKNTVELAGGEFRADGMGGGLGGSVLIDPTNLLVSADILRGSAGYGVLPDGASSAGANLTLQADQTITVNNNVTISTRSVSGTTATAHATENYTGNSGNLTLLSETITLKSGSKLLAGTETGSIYSGGDVTLTASNTSSIPAIPVISGISIDNATITGRNLSLAATSSYDDSLLTSWLPIAVPVVTSNIDVNSSTLKASGTLNLNAASLIDVNTTGLSPIEIGRAHV